MIPTLTAWIAIATLLYALLRALLHAGLLRGRLDAAHSKLVGEKQCRLVYQQRATDEARRAEELERRNSLLIMESVAMYDEIARLEAENAYLRSHYLTRKGLVAGWVMVEPKRMAGKLEVIGKGEAIP